MMTKADDTLWSHLSLAKMLLAFLSAMVVATAVLLVPIYRAALAPDDAKGSLLVAFLPTENSISSFAAIQHAGGLPVRQTAFGNFWVVQALEPGFVAEIRNAGAMAVFRDVPSGIVLAGCSGVIAQLQR